MENRQEIFENPYNGLMGKRIVDDSIGSWNGVYDKFEDDSDWLMYIATILANKRNPGDLEKKVE